MDGDGDRTILLDGLKEEIEDVVELASAPTIILGPDAKVGCPGTHALVRFAEGRGEPASERAVADHLAACGHCQSAIDFFERFSGATASRIATGVCAPRSLKKRAVRQLSAPRG